MIAPLGFMIGNTPLSVAPIRRDRRGRLRMRTEQGSARGEEKRRLRAWAIEKIKAQQADPNQVPDKFLSRAERQRRALRRAPAGRLA